MEGMVMDPQFWRGKRVFLTGHTGFKGGWLGLWLQRLGAHVTGYALEPASAPNLYQRAQLADQVDSIIGDIRDLERLKGAMQRADAEIVFHLAAQPLVRLAYADPVTTYSTNVMGTVNVLEAMRAVNPRVAVIVTTDKVYHNNEWVWPYRETDALGGHDPYSASKAACELAVSSYRASFLASLNVAVATARAGNVVGGGDWSEDRLIPDAIRSWSTGRDLVIRRPTAVRPWQHVIEPLFGYLTLAERLWERPELVGSFNFGPSDSDALSVREVVEIARTSFKDAKVVYVEETEGPHEASRLTLDSAKARDVLGVKPVWSAREALEKTMRWYRADQQQQDARLLCYADIDEYMSNTPIAPASASAKEAS